MRRRVNDTGPIGRSNDARRFDCRNGQKLEQLAILTCAPWNSLSRTNVDLPCERRKSKDATFGFFARKKLSRENRIAPGMPQCAGRFDKWR